MLRMTIHKYKINGSSPTDISRDIGQNFPQSLDRESQKLYQKSVTARLIGQQETEYKRLANELHDGVGQLLTMLNFQVDQAVVKLQNSEHKDDLVDEIKALETVPMMAREALKELRDICKSLRPSILDDLGLYKAVAFLCRRFRQASDIAISTEFNLQEESIPDILSTPMYRIVQEALSNAVRHSGAETILVCIKRAGNELQLTITDNGKGVDMQEMLPEEALGGIGHVSMRERTEALGGSFHIDSTKGKGCTVFASWPLAAAELHPIS